MEQGAEPKWVTVWVARTPVLANASFVRTRALFWLHHLGRASVEAWRQQLRLDGSIPAGDDREAPPVQVCLFHVRKSRLLQEDITLADQDLQEGDVLVLLTITEDINVTELIEFIGIQKFPEKILTDISLENGTIEDIKAVNGIPAMSRQAAKLQEPARMFCSYSHRDERLRQSLEPYLALLQRQGFIRQWSDRQISPGQEWNKAIQENLESADIILLLVSQDFLASTYAYEKEMVRAVERHDRGEARVIPVIVRPSDWHQAPFAKLQALPPAGKAVTLWKPRDQAWLAVAQGIRQAVEELRSARE